MAATTDDPLLFADHTTAFAQIGEDHEVLGVARK